MAVRVGCRIGPEYPERLGSLLPRSESLCLVMRPSSRRNAATVARIAGKRQAGGDAEGRGDYGPAVCIVYDIKPAVEPRKQGFFVAELRTYRHIYTCGWETHQMRIARIIERNRETHQSTAGLVRLAGSGNPMFSSANRLNAPKKRKKRVPYYISSLSLSLSLSCLIIGNPGFCFFSQILMPDAFTSEYPGFCAGAFKMPGFTA